MLAVCVALLGAALVPTVNHYRARFRAYVGTRVASHYGRRAGLQWLSVGRVRCNWSRAHWQVTIKRNPREVTRLGRKAKPMPEPLST